MAKTVLIAGKNSPDGKKLADGFAFTGRLVAVTGPEAEIDFKEKKTIAERRAEQASYEEAKSIEAQSGMCVFEWNKSSPISSRSIILQTENVFETLDEAVLYFDEEWFASNSDKLDSEQIARGTDEMILSYEYLTLELLSRFEKKHTSFPGTLVFLLKEGPSASDALKNPLLRNGISSIASPLVASSASAFATFAENVAALFGDKNYVNIVLVRGDSSMETCSSDEALGKWLGNYLDSVEELKVKIYRGN